MSKKNNRTSGSVGEQSEILSEAENGVVDDGAGEQSMKKARKLPWGKKREAAEPDDDAYDFADEQDALSGMIEADQIDDAASGGKANKAKKPWSTKKKVILSVVGIILVMLIGAGIYVYTLWSDPMSQFETAWQQMTPEPSVSQEPLAPGETPTPTIDPKELLAAKADQGFLNNIVNIMLIGVDHSVERDTWSGKKAFHSDVMIVLSINKETKQVSMISLPRDTYAEIPGVDGIYKLNASIDCGGSWPNESGFQKVCEAAEWMLGGEIPVDYYYAVDMNAVKGLVDAVGGVDFDLDLDFKIQGRSYVKGKQHMNGQAVLDYLRVRKNLGKGEEGDLNRINRQKKMLVAIYDKIKQQNLLAAIPDLLEAFDGNLYTNTDLGKTAALALFAYQVPSENIQMYSMGGHYQNIFNWNFVLTDQKARVELIKKVYGIDVPQYKKYTSSAANALWEGMLADKIQSKARPLLDQVKAVLDADALLPPVPTPTPIPVPPADPVPPVPPVDPLPAVPATSATSSPSPTTADPASISVRPMAVNKGSSPVGLEGEYRKYGDDVWALYNSTVSLVNSLTSIESTDAKKAANLQAKTNVQTLCGICGVAVPGGNWDKYWRVNYESEDNEIKIDFN